MSLIPSSILNNQHNPSPARLEDTCLLHPTPFPLVGTIITPSPTGSHSNQSDCSLYLVKGIIWGGRHEPLV
jgi:hypothetical protein